MSLFLGKIHFWLFDKIKCFEDLETNIIQFTEEKNIDIDTKKIYEELGMPTIDAPLEEQIDTSNIHGWLQNQIQKAEHRQAYFVNTILQKDETYLEELKEVFKLHGKKAGNSVSKANLTPKEAYEILNNFLLEGMPCDRTTDFIIDEDDKLSFCYVRCLHKKYWDKFNAKIRYFYILRNEWIKSFIQALDCKLDFSVDEKDESYENISENIFSITKN